MKRARASRGFAAPAMLSAATVSAAALTVLVISGCCRLGRDPRRDPDPSSETAPDPGPSPTPDTTSDGPSRIVGGTVDLGTVAYPPPPAGGKVGAAAGHAWSARTLKPSSYKMGYALADAESQALAEAFRAYARSVRYQPMSDGRFSWSPPRSCTGDLRCIFEALASRSRESVGPLAERFRRRAKEANLNSMQVASLVVSFLQNIRYEVPKGEPFGLLPPSLVVSQRRGDCDSKALLGHMLLDRIGIGSIILSSQAHKHAMLGLALPAPGTPFTHEGGRYAFTECTAKGSPIGHINPELLRPNDWHAVPVRLSTPSAPKPGG